MPSKLSVAHKLGYVATIFLRGMGTETHKVIQLAILAPELFDARGYVQKTTGSYVQPETELGS